MNTITIEDVAKYVITNIGRFHQKRIESIDNLKLGGVISRKNPYLFKAKYVLTAEEVVRSIVDAHISSSEEGIFGEFLEGLAIFVCQQVYGGRKSPAEGIDLEFEKDDIIYIVTIKSGPNWGNSSQIGKMKDNFRKAKRILGTNAQKRNIVSVNGCCYGRDSVADKGEFLKVCGQDFWKFISGNENLYTEIIEPLGYSAKEQNEAYLKSYAKMINKFTLEFSLTFCDDGVINWQRIVKFNSSREKPVVKRSIVRKKAKGITQIIEETSTDAISNGEDPFGSV